MSSVPALDDEVDEHAKRQPIYGGVPSTEANDAVVQLSGDNSYCTGTVVAPRLVITARHCVSPFVDGTYQCSIDGGYSSNLQRNPANAGDVGQPYDPELIKVRMGVIPFDDEPAIGEKIYTVATDTVCRNDLALVRVDRDLPVAPRPMRLKELTFPGELVSVVGYGRTFTDVPGRHERRDVEIVAVGRSTIYPEGNRAYDRMLRLGPSACPGDSGGPALSDAGAVLGVASMNENECNSDSVRNYYTQLAPYRSFIEDAFEDSGFGVLHESDSSSGAGGSARAATDSDGSGGSSAGGSEATGGSAGEATTGVTIIEGRRKKKDGCSVAVLGDEGNGGRWAPLLLGLGLLAFRRRSPDKRARR